jgi:hypothetical protein
MKGIVTREEVHSNGIEAEAGIRFSEKRGGGG